MIERTTTGTGTSQEEGDHKEANVAEDWSEVVRKRTLAHFMPPDVFSVRKSEPGEVCSACEVQGWVTFRALIDSGAIDAVGPKEVAKAFKMKETVMSNKGIGHAAANGSNISNFGETKIVARADSGDGSSMKIQRAEVKQAPG